MKRKVTRNETDSKKELNDAIRKKRMESWRQRAFDSSLLLTLYFTYSILSSFPHLSHPVAQCNPLHFVFLYHTMRHRITAETNSSPHIHTHTHTHTHTHSLTHSLTHAHILMVNSAQLNITPHIKPRNAYICIRKSKPRESG